MGVLYGSNGDTWGALGNVFDTASGLSFLVFNLLCAPCFAAIGAIKKEMNSRKWTWFAIGYETGLAYAVALVVFQLGSLIAGKTNVPGIIAAAVLILVFIWLLVRPNKYVKNTVKEG